ncbi:hypothetical protein [Rhodococcus sp. UNC23MFCrub1.1]|uniref:hypothetical protein n=1 Tax=Rhodococcus sp. UNC23MFCrub1.1 TaxID=1449068 RepID=UPI0012DF8040|nr:hypothetical protein [Rhodococcus sp. UNC23MFCrub1.1]
MQWRQYDPRASAAAGTGAYTACLAVMSTPPTDLMVAERDSPVSSVFLSPAWAGVVAVVVVLTAVRVAFTHSRRGLITGVGAAGTAVLATPAAVDISTAWSVTVAGVGSGLILVTAVTLAHTSRTAFVALALGAASAYRFSPLVAQQYPDHFRWSVSLPGDAFFPEPVVPIPVLVVTAVLLASTISMPHVVTRGPRTVHWRMAAAVSLLWVVYALLGDYSASVGQWTVAAAATVVVIVGAAIGSADSGAFLCAGLAVACTFVGGMVWNAWWLVLLAIAGFTVGALAARWAPSTPVGCCILALVCASALFPYGLVSTVGYAVVLPAAIVYSLLSSRPSDPTITSVGLLIPTMLAVVTLSAPPDRPYEFGWTGSADRILVLDPGTVGSRSVLAVVVAMCAAVVAAGVAARVDRRNHKQQSAS